jgi:hypothetical protein
MSSSADLFSQDLVQPDLRGSAAWRDIPDPQDPSKTLEWVKESFCGRYTITWSARPIAEDPEAKIFLLWRRHPLVNGRKPTPSLIDGFLTARGARLVAAEHAEANP